MKRYDYVAHDHDGVKKRGTVLSSSKARALKALRSDSLFAAKLRKSKFESLRFSTNHLHAFTKRLYLLLKSGLPLYESVLLVEEQSRSKKEKRILKHLLTGLRSGQRFSEAIEETMIFDPLYIALLQSGEMSGQLEESILVVSQLLEQKQLLKNKIVTALSYPLFVAGFALVSFYVLLLFVIPNFEPFFESVEVPTFTKTIFFLSHKLADYQLSIFSTTVVTSIGIYMLPLRKWFWKLPILKSLAMQRDLFLFSKAFCSLYTFNVELLSILKLSENLVLSPKLKTRLEKMQTEIAVGGSLSESFSKLKIKQPFFLQMIKVGEKSSDLSSAFAHIAAYYEAMIDNRIKKLITFLQPAVLLVVAGIIGVVMLSILVPMTDVSKFID